MWIAGYAGVDIAESLIGPEASLRLVKTSLANRPADVFLLLVIIDRLTKLGRHEEAGHYLEQLYQYDPDDRGAEVVDRGRRIAMGELALDSPELEAFLGNPLSSPFDKGRCLLMLGDVERGVEHLRQMNETSRAVLAEARSLLDRGLPPEVVADPRYRAVFEELGIGDSWREYLIEKVKEMEPHTGIGYPARVSVSMADIYPSAGDE